MAETKALSVADAACRLLASDAWLVVMHRRPDGDTAGAGAALMRLLAAMGKKIYGICADKIPERLDFLLGDLPVGTALPDGKYAVVTVDVASVAQMGGVADLLREKNIAVDLMIDHHAMGESYADHLTVPDAAAAGEIVYDIACEWVRTGALAAIPTDVRTCLYAALSSDTGCFRYSNATPKTLRTAAALLEDPAVDTARVNHLLFEAKSERQLRAEAYAIEHTETSDGGKLGWTVITLKEKEALDVEEEHLETVIDMVRAREGVEIAVALRETADGEYKASMRSNGFNVAEIAALFGGGGHVRAAGCSAPGKTADEALTAVLSAIRERMR